MTIDETYRDQPVFLTGHTGFKGAWLSLWLTGMGARVTGYSDRVPTSPSAFELVGLHRRLTDLRGDVADAGAVLRAMQSSRPAIVFHLAAQAIVRAGFADPLGTFATNVMGTAAVLEAARQVDSVRAVVIVTSDKVYDNPGSVWAFRETDALGGKEPYGVSKAAAELVTNVYRSAAFHHAAGSANHPAIATARAGNVIGGGDWAADRLIPDFVRAIVAGRDQVVRQPRATRPWQHVLEPLGGYLLLGRALLNGTAPDAVNFGPADAVLPDVAAVVTTFLRIMDPPATRMVIREDAISAEARVLRVDSSLAAATLGWAPAWTADQAIGHSADWYRGWMTPGTDLDALSRAQLAAYRAQTPVAALRYS